MPTTAVKTPRPKGVTLERQKVIFAEIVRLEDELPVTPQNSTNPAGAHIMVLRSAETRAGKGFAINTAYSIR